MMTDEGMVKGKMHRSRQIQILKEPYLIPVFIIEASGKYVRVETI
jgi:hypothetical protein